MSIAVKSIDLAELEEDVPGMTWAIGATMAEACVVCLEDQGHGSGAIIKVDGVFEQEFALTWKGHVTDGMRRCWRNAPNATQRAAHGLSILLLKALTGYVVLAGADRKYHGFNYWLGPLAENDDIREARLVVAGMRSASRGRLATRAKPIEESTARISNGYPTYVTVVEFSGPTVRITKT